MELWEWLWSWDIKMTVLFWMALPFIAIIAGVVAGVQKIKEKANNRKARNDRSN